MEVTHNNLPEAVAYLIGQIEVIGAAVSKIQENGISDNDTMTIKEVAELTKKSVDTIYRYTATKTIPHKKIGNSLSFSRKEIEAWRNEHRVKLATEIEDEAENRMIALNKKKARAGTRAN